MAGQARFVRNRAFLYGTFDLDLANSTKLHKQRSAKAARLSMKLRAIEYLGGMCADCKKMPHHACMEFHHCNPENKEFSLSSILAQVSAWIRIKNELDKCILLCSNCHQIRHWELNNKDVNREDWEKADLLEIEL